jgi:hypothetical protein
VLTNKKIRVIKRGQAEARPEPAPAAEPRADKEPLRAVKTVVSGWVSEHRQRAEEFRKAYSTLLKEVGFNAPRDCARC